MAARYVCTGNFATGGEYCLGLGGAAVDRRFSEEILEPLPPHGLKASVAAIERLNHQGSSQRAHLECEPVSSILKRPKATGMLALEGGAGQTRHALEALSAIAPALPYLLLHPCSRRPCARRLSRAGMHLGCAISAPWLALMSTQPCRPGYPRRARRGALGPSHQCPSLNPLTKAPPFATMKPVRSSSEAVHPLWKIAFTRSRCGSAVPCHPRRPEAPAEREEGWLSSLGPRGPC
jgi:hypothetical protein